MKWVFVVLGVLVLAGDGSYVRDPTAHQLGNLAIQVVLALALFALGAWLHLREHDRR